MNANSFHIKTRKLQAQIALLRQLLKRKDTTQNRMRMAFVTLMQHRDSLAVKEKEQAAIKGKIFSNLILKLQMRRTFLKLRQRYIFPSVMSKKRDPAGKIKKPNPRYADEESTSSLKLVFQQTEQPAQNTAVHLKTDDQIRKVTDDHRLYLQQVMRQRILVVRKQALLRWKTNVIRVRQAEIKQTTVFQPKINETKEALLRKKTIRLMLIHLEKTREMTLKIAF